MTTTAQATENRSVYAICKRIRAFLMDLPPGDYTPTELFQRIVRAEIAHAWEVKPNTIANSIRGFDEPHRSRWVHNGKSARGSAWTKTPPPVAPAAPAPPEMVSLLPVEPTTNEDLEAIVKALSERMTRVERMVERLCSNLGVSTE